MAFTDYTSYASLLDNFNRSNEGPPPSGSWNAGAVSTGTSQLQVVSNALKRGGAGWGSGYWGTQIGADVIAYITLSTVGDVELGVRAKDLGSGSTFDYYGAEYISSTHTLTLYKYTNGSGSSLGTSTTATLAGGDKYGIMAIGSNITVATYQSGSWTDRITASDATYGATGYITIWMNGTTPIIDDLYAGQITSASYTPRAMLLGMG